MKKCGARNGRWEYSRSPSISDPKVVQECREVAGRGDMATYTAAELGALL